MNIKSSVEQVRKCGVRINGIGLIELKIGDEIFGFAVKDARTFANQIKQMVRQATGLTNRRRKKTLKDKKQDGVVFGKPVYIKVE